MQAYPILETPRGRSAFRYPDPEGAPDSDGRRYHGALDWFAPGFSPVRSALAGEVVEANPSRGTHGQIFGGTCKVRAASGVVVVMRHVSPHVSVGQRVEAGQRVAIVTAWADGPPHVHLEVWRTLAGGYYLPNMIDPDTLTWTTDAAEPRALPHSASLRLVIGERRWAGWQDCVGPMLNVARHGLLASTRCAIAWRGHTWRGPHDVSGVVGHLLDAHNLR